MEKELLHQKAESIARDIMHQAEHLYSDQVNSSDLPTVEDLIAYKVEELLQETEELRAWKAQATAVLPDYQAIGKALNVPLGHSVSEHLLPGILNLLKDRHELVIQLRRQQAYCTRYVRAYQSTARYREVEALLDKHHHSTVEP